MLGDDRKRLKKTTILLINNLEVVGLGDLLYEDDIISDEELELIRMPSLTTKGKVRQLLKILRNHKSNDVFVKFCSALRKSGEENEYMAEALEGADITGMEEVTIDEPDANANELRNQIVRQSDMMMNMREQHQREVLTVLY